MKYFLLFILTIVLFACSTNEPEKVEVENIEVVEEPLIDTVVEEKIEIPVLPFFDLQFENEDFELFYYDLVKNCLPEDTAKVLAAIYDTLRFSKYECAYGQFVKSNECENCTRCTKKGMIEGVFAKGNKFKLCEQLYDMITKFGVGKFADNEYYSKYMPVPNAYSNFHFVEDSMYAKYFNYEAILPLHDKVEVKTEISTVAPSVGYLPLQTLRYYNDPGMGQYDELTETNWLEFNQGYINSNEVLTGFDYTLVIYEKTSKGWKITGFFQPPGC